MAILLNPISLPASKFLATMTSFINDIRVNETLKPGDIINDLVDSCRVGNVESGKGIVNTFFLDVQPVNDLSETSTALKITKPNVAQETIVIDKYKVIPLSVSDILARDAVPYGMMVDTFLNSVMALLESTEKFHLFDEVNAIIQDWTPGQSTQTVNIDQIDTTSLTGVELNAALQWNATEIARVMRKTMNNMKIKNSKFTDEDKYTDANGGGEKSVVSCLSNNDVKLTMNDTYYTNFLADALASLYHSEKVGEMIPADNFVLIPEDGMKSGNEKVIGWLSGKNKFALADFYRVQLSFTDPSTLYTNSFLHISYGVGVFKYVPAVKFVANVRASA